MYSEKSKRTERELVIIIIITFAQPSNDIYYRMKPTCIQTNVKV